MVWLELDFEVNQTKIKGGCQSGRKVIPHDSKSDLPLIRNANVRLRHFLQKSELEASKVGVFFFSIFLRYALA